MSQDGLDKRADASSQPETPSGETSSPQGESNLPDPDPVPAEDPAADTADGNDESTAGPDLAPDVHELASQVAELQESLLRKQADFENFRRRLNRDKEDAIRFANQELVTDVVSVLDDFERALQSAQTNRDFDTLSEGVGMIEKQLSGVLERKWGLSSYSSEGEDFDPERHEAIAAEESSEAQSTTVLVCYQKGYILNGRVIRPARVRVSKPAGA